MAEWFEKTCAQRKPIRPMTGLVCLHKNMTESLAFEGSD